MNQDAKHMRDRTVPAPLRVQIIGPWPVINEGVCAVVREEVAGEVKVSNTIVVEMEYAFADLIHAETRLLIVILTAGSLPEGAFDAFLERGGRHLLMVLPKHDGVTQAQTRGATYIPFDGNIMQWRKAVRRALSKLTPSESEARGQKLTCARSSESQKNDVKRLLTPRQAQVFGFISGGLSNKDIASELGLSVGTVKLHVAAVLRALNARNRIEVLVRNAQSSAASVRGFGGGFGSAPPA